MLHRDKEGLILGVWHVGGVPLVPDELLTVQQTERSSTLELHEEKS